MRAHRPQVVIITVMILLMMVAAGCGTPIPKRKVQRPVAGQKETSSPFLQRGDYPDRLGLVIQEVLADHRFSLPGIVVRGPDSSTWFVAERFESAQRFDRLCVQVTSEEAVTASITAYDFVLSDWAILGKLFVDFDREARTVAAKIARKLNDKAKY